MEDLIEYLHQHVPQTRNMGFKAGELCADSLTLEAPLSVNLNDKQTAFGGTLATLCTIAGWTMVSVICRDSRFDIDIVVAESRIRYLAPVRCDPICARAMRPSNADVTSLLSNLDGKGFGALTIDAMVKGDQPESVLFSGRYMVKNLDL